MRLKWKATETTFISMVLAYMAPMAFTAELIVVNADCDSATNFLCNDGKTCITKLYVCNGVPDCPDRGDETECGKSSWLFSSLMINFYLTFRHEEMHWRCLFQVSFR